MAYRRENRILERSYITGTGDIILAGEVAGYFPFSHRLADGDTCDYAIERTEMGLPVDEFEVGIATFRTGPARLERTTVVASSNADALVSFTTGPKKVALIILAESQDQERYVEFPAGVALGGNRVVRLDAGDVVYADNTVAADANRVLGITTGAVSLGAPARIQVSGLMTEVSWSWTPDAPIFLSTTGLLTQAPPTSGFSLIVGFATSATQMFIGPKTPIALV